MKDLIELRKRIKGSSLEQLIQDENDLIKLYSNCKDRLNFNHRFYCVNPYECDMKQTYEGSPMCKYYEAYLMFEFQRYKLENVKKD
jgi:hypothetical protein